MAEMMPHPDTESPGAKTAVDPVCGMKVALVAERESVPARANCDCEAGTKLGNIPNIGGIFYRKKF